MLYPLMQGLIVSSRKESLQHFKQPWAHEHEPVKGLLEAVKVTYKSGLSYHVKFCKEMMVME